MRSSAEIGFDPDMTLQDLEGIDHLYILSPPTAEFADPRRSPAKLRWLDRTGVTTGCLLGRVIPVGTYGLLEGKACSVHWCYEAAFQGGFPERRGARGDDPARGPPHHGQRSRGGLRLMLRLDRERLGRDS